MGEAQMMRCKGVARLLLSGEIDQLGFWSVDAGLKRQHLRRLCSQRKPAIGQEAVPTLHEILNLSFAQHSSRDYYRASAEWFRFLVDGIAAGTSCSSYGCRSAKRLADWDAQDVPSSLGLLWALGAGIHEAYRCSPGLRSAWRRNDTGAPLFQLTLTARRVRL